jgi:hypothetical protein
MIIAVDFDGTVVENGSFPEVGKDLPQAQYWLKRYEELGAQIVLWTCRTGLARCYAEKWFKDHLITLTPLEVAENHHISPGRKVHADVYIDDKAAGVPTRLVPTNESGQLSPTRRS